MSMSRKNFVAIAESIKDVNNKALPEGLGKKTQALLLKDRQEVLRSLVSDLRYHFSSECPGFDYPRFYAACGLEN